MLPRLRSSFNSGSMTVRTMLDLDAETIYRQLARRAREHFRDQPLNLVGVHTGGVWLAERLKRELNVEAPVGILDVSFYRDDFDQSGLKSAVQALADRVRRGGQSHSAGRRCSEYRTHRARSDERNLRLRAAREDRPGCPDRPRRPRPADSRQHRRRDDRVAGIGERRADARR